VGSVPMDLTLVTPNGGEAWYRDSTVTIAWVGGTPGANVLIELSRNGTGGPWSVLTSSTPNDGAFPWTVSGATSSTCRIRLTDVSDPLQTDISAADFAIGAIQMVLFEDFEDSAPDWSHSSAGGSWVDNWHVSIERALSGIRSYKCGDQSTGQYAALNDARLVSPTLVNLPANATLEFFYQITSELSGAYPDSAYDGGIVEVSADGGAFAQVTPTGGYPKTSRFTSGGGNPFTGPMPGQPCLAGDVAVWTSQSVDLSTFAGQDIQVRFRFGSDQATENEGWYVDDVRVHAPTFTSEPVVPVNVTLYPLGSDLILRWAPDSNTAYRIYSGSTPDNPFEFLEGSTSSTQFLVPGGAGAVKRFYVVVGWDGN